LGGNEKILVTILSVIGFYTIVSTFIDIDDKYFNGNLFISCILIPLFLGPLLAGVVYLFHPEKKHEKIVGLYYLGIGSVFGWLFYVIVLV
jgi:hypothetical protein